LGVAKSKSGLIDIDENRGYTNQKVIWGESIFLYTNVPEFYGNLKLRIKQCHLRPFEKFKISLELGISGQFYFRTLLFS